MPSPFNITALTPIVQLNSQRRGEASYTVSNAIGSPIRGHARLIALGNATAEWLNFVGETDRDFSITGTQQYTVDIQVPDTAAAGDYTFRLDMVGVENPDDLYSQGQPVTFKVPPPAPPPPPKVKGYIPATVGALVGGLASISAALIFELVLILLLNATLSGRRSTDALITILYGFILLTSAGIVCSGVGVGSWFALKWRPCDWPTITGRIAAGIMFVLTILFILAAWGALSTARGVGPFIIILLAIPVLLALAGLIARAITRQWKAGSL